MNRVEKLARLYCQELLMDADAKVCVAPFAIIKRWTLYADRAERELSGAAWQAALDRLAKEESAP